jgi:hypothetical protein
VTLEQVLAALEADGRYHMLGDPCQPDDLARLQGALGRSLPADFRLLLERIGCGFFYEKHEIFGARRLMVHDIELVPDLLSVRRTLGAGVPSYVLPFHRAAGTCHLLDLRDATGRVLPGDHAREPLDLAGFLERVVLASAPRGPRGSNGPDGSPLAG